jgi:hypothetical protein
LGVDCHSVCAAAAKLKSQPYSLERVKHLLLPPARRLQDTLPKEGIFCGDIVTRCLPQDLVRRIFSWLNIHHCHPPAVAAIGLDGEPFLTPNGIAFALGLQPGHTVTGHGQDLPINVPGDL